MNPPDVPYDEPPDALAREAAGWFARMRAPDAEGSRRDFEAWLGSSAAHRSAYNRAAEVFAIGKLLDEPERPAPISRRTRATAVLAVCAAAALAGGSWMLLRHSGSPDASTIAVRDIAADLRQVSTIAGETRIVRLADGSAVRLGGSTTLNIAFDKDRRLLKLSHGSARFEVAHEPRPFVVMAGGGSVTARGTIFDVALRTSGRIDVKLLQGAIDVALPSGAAREEARTVRRLTAGESLSWIAKAAVPKVSVTNLMAPLPGEPRPREFRGVSVAALIAEANRGASYPIELADDALANHRLSGRFRIDDTKLLAERLGALLDAEIGRGASGAFVLHPRQAGRPTEESRSMLRHASN